MSIETKTIAKIKVVTDTETNQYKLGEIVTGFDKKQLKEYIEAYGHAELCENLAMLQWQVWEALREVNSEKQHTMVAAKRSN